MEGEQDLSHLVAPANSRLALLAQSENRLAFGPAQNLDAPLLVIPNIDGHMPVNVRIPGLILACKLKSNTRLL